MEDEANKSSILLQNSPYRSLQQIAKSMGLPSNFKKIYLIEMIQAKNYKSEMEVERIIKRVKLERIQLSRRKRENKRLKLQNTGNTPTHVSCFSPPITVTPKRVRNIYSNVNLERSKTDPALNPRRNIIKNVCQVPTTSDRVLRSYSTKSPKPNYALLNGEEIQLCPKKNMNVVENGEYQEFTVKPLNSSPKRKIVLAKNVEILQKQAYKRRHLLSGIYPLFPKEIPQNIRTTESVCLIKVDGNVSKINALVQKRHHLIPKLKSSYRNSNINIQEVSYINNINITNNNTAECNNNYLQIEYPNVANDNSNFIPQISMPIIPNETRRQTDAYPYYYGKPTPERVRIERTREYEKTHKLPKISDVFSKFNYVHKMNSLTEPLYVQVSKESERTQNYHYHKDKEVNTMMLEKLYNFKNDMITNTPLLKIATTTKTKCVYSTLTVATPIAHPSTVVSNDTCVSSYVEDMHGHSIDPRMYDFLEFPEDLRRTFDFCDDFEISSSLDLSQDLSTSATIPEMVEDALEIISQDGDYLERISMDLGVECVVCSWAGPKITLEEHIRKEHSDEIQNNYVNSWNITYTLGSLYSRRWKCRILEHDNELYALSAAADPDSSPGCLLTALQSLSPQKHQKFGLITTYNRVSGEPYSWRGPIQPYMPYENINDCLKVELNKLDLIPNSANLKILNRALVSDSPNKAIVGQQMLNDIHIIIFVNISN